MENKCHCQNVISTALNAFQSRILDGKSTMKKSFSHFSHQMILNSHQVDLCVMMALAEIIRFEFSCFWSLSLFVLSMEHNAYLADLLAF